MTQNHTLEWTFPLPRTHCGVALGNGNFGALVWGAERLNVTVNRADFWDHRGGEILLEGTTYERLKAAYDPHDRAKLEAAFIRKPRKKGELRSSRLPVGRFEFTFADGLAPQRAVLDVRTGRLFVTMTPSADGIAHELMLVLDPERNLLFVEDTHGLIADVTVRPSWEWVGAELSKYRFEPPQIITDDGLQGWIQSCPDDPALASLCRRIDSGYAIELSLAPTADEALAAGVAELTEFAGADRTLFLHRTEKWWQEYWTRVPEVDLPSEFFSRFMTYALWKFACATNPHSPLPAGLQGPWIEEYQLAPWSGDYHFNVNIQQIYTLAFPTGNYAHLLPLFDMLESFHEVMWHNALVLFDIDDGLALAHAVDDRGYACGGISAGSSIDHAVLGWTAQLYWLYYRYTGDIDFLRNRAYPFMYGVMRSYEEMLEDDGDRLSLPLSISAEYAQSLPGGKSQNAGRDPSYQLACIHMLAEALIETAAIIGVPPRPIWHEIRTKLPSYTLIGEPGQERIAVWEGQDLDICHRHHSHLAAIYPFDTLNLDDDTEQQIIANSIDHWILKGMGQWSEWCIPWAAIIEARLGFKDAPLVLLKLWREIFINEGMTTVYLPWFPGITAHRRADIGKPKELHEVMQLDGCMAGATAIYEMLIHNRRGTTYIFPAVAEQWPDVAFRRIRVPGAFLVSAERRDGATQSVSIESLQGGSIRLAVPDRDMMRLCRNGAESEVTLPAVLDLAAGEVATLA